MKQNDGGQNQEGFCTPPIFLDQFMRIDATNWQRSNRFLDRSWMRHWLDLASDDKPEGSLECIYRDLVGLGTSLPYAVYR